jgi:hypothetical protein
VLAELNSVGLCKGPAVKFQYSAGFQEPAVIPNPHHRRFGCAGSKSGSDGGFEPAVLSRSGVVKHVSYV